MMTNVGLRHPTRNAPYVEPPRLRLRRIRRHEVEAFEGVRWIVLAEHRLRHVDTVGQRVRRRQECPAPTGGDLGPRPPLVVDVRVVGVVVAVAGDHHDRVDPLGHELALDELEVAVGVRVLDVGPARLGRAEDQPVVALHQRRRAAEVGDLGAVDVGVVLDVDAPQPMPVRQAEREVAAALLGLTPADPGLLPEHAHEAGQPVVPVVVAGDRVHHRMIGVGPRQRRLERAEEPVLVLGG